SSPNTVSGPVRRRVGPVSSDASHQLGVRHFFLQAPALHGQSGQPLARATYAMTFSTSPAGTSRLNKRMAELGLCSRREADAWIANGWVRVNGVVAAVGLQVAADARIDVDPRARGQQQQQVTILLHKPVGYVSGQAEDGHAPAATLIQARNHWRGDTS